MENNLIMDKIQQKKSTIITIRGHIGTVGKTLVAKELALEYASRQLKVCLIDMDIYYGDIHVQLNLNAKKNIADWARDIKQRVDQIGEGRIEYSYDEMNSYLVKHKSGLKILTAPTNIKDVSLIDEDIVKIIVNNLKSMFDIIIIDTGNNMKDFTITSMLLSDKILLVGNPSILNINEILYEMRLYEKINIPINKVSLLINNVDIEELNLIGELPKIKKYKNNYENFTTKLKRIADLII